MLDKWMLDIRCDTWTFASLVMGLNSALASVAAGWKLTG